MSFGSNLSVFVVVVIEW